MLLLCVGLYHGIASAQSLRLVPETGHTSSILSTAFSPNGHTLASGSDDNTIQLWDVATGKELRRLEGHSQSVSSVAFSPDGRTLASGSYDTTIRLWDVATGKELSRLEGHTDEVFSVAFSSDGYTLASGSRDKTIRLWDVATGKELRRLEGHTDYVYSVAFSPDGHILASGSGDKTIRLWDVATGKELSRLEGHTNRVYSVAFSPDGHTLASGSKDTTNRIWDVRTGRCLYTRFGFEEGSWIAVAPDGRYDSSDYARPHFGHFVMDLPGEMSEVVGFDQVRTKDYYEPDLVSKIMDGSYKPGEQPLLSQKPAPKVEQRVEGSLVKFRVTERFGGGIGDVRISVNSQTVKTFLKGEVSSGVSMTWNGTGFVTPDAVVEVVADNGLETLTSARAVTATAELPPSNEPIRFVGIAMGVKSYLGGVKPLKFAGADSVAMARAMLTLAKSLGVGVSPEIYLLTDEEVPADLKALVTVLPPTKASYTTVVAKIKGTKFTSNTLLFLDFSGHGVMLGDEYLYLTKDARTADPLQLKNQMECGITMPEILNLLNLCLTGKRLLVLDTCQAAGAEKLLASNLKTGEAELDAQKRTIADWQNRYAVGTQVLMGCPEGASSYEDPRYGHGLLTYSLLYCLQNNDLGDKPGDPEVLANKLVEQSAEQTKAIAAQLGFNQFAQPLGAHAFLIGMMKREDRQKAIVLPNPKPAIGSCTLFDENDFPADQFNKAFVAELESSTRGGTIVHVPSQQAPGVWIVTGKYLKSVGGQITLRLNLSQGARHEKLPEITSSEAEAAADAYKAISKWLDSVPGK